MTGFCLIYQRLGTILELTSVKLPYKKYKELHHAEDINPMKYKNQLKRGIKEVVEKEILPLRTRK